MLTLATFVPSGWACPIPTASVSATNVYLGKLSMIVADFQPGTCPPVGDPWISAISINTNGLHPAADGEIDWAINPDFAIGK